MTLPIAVRASVVVWLIQAGGLGCDAGDAALEPGPKLRLLLQRPIAGEGLDCDPTESSCGFPVNQPFVFAFDRWLLPSTATRQSFRAGPVGVDAGVFSLPSYDLIRRSVSYRLGNGWGEGFVYDLQLYDASQGDADWGFRAYDDQPLDRSNIAEHVLFRVGAARPIASESSALSETPRCRDALQAFAAAGCSAAQCHHAAQGCAGETCKRWPPAGLALDSRAGLVAAIGRVARATDRGPRSGEVTIMPERFGMNLPIVEPNEPAFSLLMYRMLLGRDAYRDAAGKFVVEPPTRAELERARSWFGVIGEMPPPEVGWPSDLSPFKVVGTLQDWVLGGADTTDCE